MTKAILFLRLPVDLLQDPLVRDVSRSLPSTVLVKKLVAQIRIPLLENEQPVDVLAECCLRLSPLIPFLTSIRQLHSDVVRGWLHVFCHLDKNSIAFEFSIDRKVLIMLLRNRIVLSIHSYRLD